MAGGGQELISVLAVSTDDMTLRNSSEVSNACEDQLAVVLYSQQHPQPLIICYNKKTTLQVLTFLPIGYIMKRLIIKYSGQVLQRQGVVYDFDHNIMTVSPSRSSKAS